jgi:hypothetical protein
MLVCDTMTIRRGYGLQPNRLLKFLQGSAHCRCISTRILKAQKLAQELIDQRPLGGYKRETFLLAKQALDTFKYKDATDVTSVNRALYLLERIVKELRRKPYPSRRRFGWAISPEYLQPLFINWKVAVLNHTKNNVASSSSTTSTSEQENHVPIITNAEVKEDPSKKTTDDLDNLTIWTPHQLFFKLLELSETLPRKFDGRWGICTVMDVLLLQQQQQTTTATTTTTTTDTTTTTNTGIAELFEDWVSQMEVASEKFNPYTGKYNGTIKPTAPVYNRLLEAWCRAAIMKTTKTITATTTTTAINNNTQNNNTNECDTTITNKPGEVLRRMKKQKVSMTIATYRMLLWYWSQRGRSDKIQEIFTYLREEVEYIVPDDHKAPEKVVILYGSEIPPWNIQYTHAKELLRDAHRRVILAYSDRSFNDLHSPEIEQALTNMETQFLEMHDQGFVDEDMKSKYTYWTDLFCFWKRLYYSHSLTHASYSLIVYDCLLPLPGHQQMRSVKP